MQTKEEINERQEETPAATEKTKFLPFAKFRPERSLGYSRG